MTFPIDFHRHPKLSRLSVDARWTFVEMNGEARLAENDGRFAIEEAEFLWQREHLDELVKSHPSRPLVLRTDTEYVIRDYAEHQFTKADRDELREKKSKAGRASAEKRSARAQQVLNETEHPPTESESESGLGDYYPPHTSQSLDTRAREATDSFEISEVTRQMAARAGIRDLAGIARAVDERLGLRIDPFGAMALATHLIGKASKHPDSPDRYVTRCLELSPAEVERFIHDSGLAA